ncbi:unnamed protein product [Protopolystoma xenopodis]|uniref:Uncharacterized protein n=1 Tax=Protopolystoma xenopodis TaxID=117903 RepID=A0A3S5CSB4_9PLAT|nr:unnamed protein product [Protopolystoma xenopodis]
MLSPISAHDSLAEWIDNPLEWAVFRRPEGECKPALMTPPFEQACTTPITNRCLASNPHCHRGTRAGDIFARVQLEFVLSTLKPASKGLYSHTFF